MNLQKTCWICAFMWISHFTSAQYGIPEYGTHYFGNSFEEPFHSSFEISQDTLGRIHFYKGIDYMSAMVYDGSQFKEVQKEENDFERKIINHTIYKGVFLKDPFTAVFIFDQDTLYLNTKDLLYRNIVDVKKVDEHYYVLNNDGVIKIHHKEDSLKVDYILPLQTERIVNFEIKQDTLFFQGHSFYYVEKNRQIIPFDDGQPKNNDLFILPHQRILVGRQILRPSDPAYSFLYNLEDDIVIHECDSKGRLWLYLRQEGRIGVFLWNGVLKKIELDIEPTTYVSDFYEDQLGDFWIGLIGQGLIQLYNQSIVILDKKYGLSSDNIWAINKDNKDRLLFSQGCSGIMAVNKKGQFKNLDKQSCQSWVYPIDEDVLFSSSVGINVYKNDQLIDNLSKKEGLFSRTAQVVHRDQNNQLWIGTRRAIHKYENGSFSPYIIEDTDVYDRVIGIKDANKSELLLLLDNGFLYGFWGGVFTKWMHQVESPNGLFNGLASSYWISSSTKGLYYIDDEKPIQVKHPQLPSNISYLEITPSGYLWGLTGDNRIFYVKESSLLNADPSEEIHFLTYEDGLPLISTNTKVQPASIQLEEGKIIFPNIHGAILIDTEKILINKPDFKIALNTENQGLIENTVFQLPYGQQFINLDIEAIYTNPQTHIIHAYKLNNTDDWKTIKDHESFSLGRLPVGKNTLHIKSKHANGEWSDEGKYFIVVQPLYFQTFWFWILVFLTIGLGSYLFIQWRIKTLKDQKKKLQATIDAQTLEIMNEKDQLAESLAKQKQLTQSLNEIQESKNKMYAQIAHEFKSPLQSVKTLLDRNLAYSQKETSIIKRSIDHLLSISKEMMQLSKAERGQLKLKSNWYNLVGIIQDQINMLQPIAQAKGVDIVFKKDHPTFFIQVDFNLMQSVVQNLLSNAIKFSKEKSTVEVNFSVQEIEIEVSFTDHGIGVPKHEINQLTKPYFQASNNDRKGTGIGLSLVKRVLELHQSQLQINSTLNQGSIFSFRLPSPKETQEVIMTKHYNHQDLNTQIQSIIDPEKPIILTLDDREEILFFIKQSLSPQYNVLMAKNGLSALKALDKIKPVLIISDLNMPVMGGLEFLEKIRLDQQLTSLPFIMLTGSSSEATEVKSLELGVDAILKKPIDGEKLKYHVDNLIHRNTELLSAARKTFIHHLIPTNIHNDDKLLMQELEDFLLDNIHNNTLKSNEIADALNMGEKTLRNRIKSITGFTVKEYLKRYRLEKAKYLLENQYGNKSEVAQAVGFSSLSYFSRCYHAYFVEK